MATGNSYDSTLAPELKACRGRVLKAFRDAEKVHRPYADRWREQQSLYLYHQALQEYVQKANDRDVAAREAAHAWKSNLCIPLIFGAIEVIVPRAISNNPTMTVKPKKAEGAAAAMQIKELLEQQQLDIDYDLKLEPTVRRGFKHGLGVQKISWKHTTRKVVRESKRSILPGNKAELREIVTFDGPDVEDVDIFDFFWDPSARSVETARYLIQRTWRDIGYIKQKVESEDWLPLDLEEVQKTRGSADTSFTTDPFLPSGVAASDMRAGRDHEVLEYHDREHVYTILNRQFVAVHDITPFYHREMPFQIFRPTLHEGQFVGIGEIEPIKHLQYELNTLRSQRRDNAAVVIDRVFAYQEGMLDPSMLQRGPGVAIATIGDPRETIFPIPVEDLPSSSYREEDAIKADFDRATGIDDSVAGASSGDTATGTQLVQAAANVRISHKTKRLMRETIRPAARQFIELNRQHVTKKKSVRIDDPEQPEGYRFEQIDPEIFAHAVEVSPDAGSTEPDNIVQKRNDALTLYNQLNGNPGIDQEALLKHLLDEHDIADAKSWLVPVDEQPPPEGAPVDPNAPPVAVDPNAAPPPGGPAPPDLGAVIQAVAHQLREMGTPETPVPDARVEQFIQSVLDEASGGAPASNGAVPQPA